MQLIKATIYFLLAMLDVALVIYTRFNLFDERFLVYMLGGMVYGIIGYGVFIAARNAYRDRHPVDGFYKKGTAEFKSPALERFIRTTRNK